MIICEKCQKSINSIKNNYYELKEFNETFPAILSHFHKECVDFTRGVKKTQDIKEYSIESLARGQ